MADLVAIEAELHRLAMEDGPDAARCAAAFVALVWPFTPPPNVVVRWLEFRGWTSGWTQYGWLRMTRGAENIDVPLNGDRPSYPGLVAPMLERLLTQNAHVDQNRLACELWAMMYAPETLVAPAGPATAPDAPAVAESATMTDADRKAQEDRERILQCADLGEVPDAQVALALSVSTALVQRVRREAGIPGMGQDGRTRRAVLAALREGHTSRATIASAAGVSVATVRHHLCALSEDGVVVHKRRDVWALVQATDGNATDQSVQQDVGDAPREAAAPSASDAPVVDDAAPPTTARKLNADAQAARERIARCSDLGDIPDTTIARALSVSPVLVGVVRREMGIPPVNPFEHTRRKVMSALMDGRTSLAAIAAAAGIDEQSAHAALRTLRKDGVVTDQGGGTWAPVHPASSEASDG